MENLKFDFRYLVKNKKEWLVTIIIFIGAMICLFFSGEDGMNKFNNIGSFLQSITAIAALFIATSVLREERLKNLDKKLTVIFNFENQPVIVCENAYLAGTSDIRQWGQSIGQLMNSGKDPNEVRLDFEPFIQEKDTILLHNNKQYRHYTVTFTLTKLPKKFEDLYKRGEYKAWSCSLDNDSKTDENRQHKQLSAPKTVTNVPNETPQ